MGYNRWKVHAQDSWTARFEQGTTTYGLGVGETGLLVPDIYPLMFYISSFVSVLFRYPFCCWITFSAGHTHTYILLLLLVNVITVLLKDSTLTTRNTPTFVLAISSVHFRISEGAQAGKESTVV